MDIKLLTIFCFLVSPKVVHLVKDLGIGPVFIWHGASECDEAFATQKLKRIFEERGSLVKTVRIGKTCWDDKVATYLNVDYQVDTVCNQLSNDTDLANGFTAIGLSQGGLLVRALVQKCPTVNVTNLISMGGPQGGNFGLPICEALTSELYQAFCFTLRNIEKAFGFGPTGLTPILRLTPRLSYSSMWNDPYRHPLPATNAIAALNNIANPKESYKKNLLSLKKFIAIYFNPDLALHPFSTGRFDEYKPGTTDVVIPYNETEHYKKDLIGLRTLDETGRYFPIECMGIHMNYTEEWFDENVIYKHLVGQATK